MKNERTLSFCLSKKLSKSEIADVSAAGRTTEMTRMATYAPDYDVVFDVNYD